MAAIKSFGQQVKELATGKYLMVKPVIPSGSLTIRKLTGGASQFYWRYTLAGKAERVPIGIYDASAPPKSLSPTGKGYSVAAANRAAETLAEQHKSNLEIGGFPALVAARAEARTKAVEAREAAELAKQAAAQHTLRNLLIDYCGHLQYLERGSHRSARTFLKTMCLRRGL